MKLNYEYEILKTNDGVYAVCEYRWGDHSVNTKILFRSDSRKECNEWLKEQRKLWKKMK